MTLREARILFSNFAAKLPGKAEVLGLQLAFDEVKRSKACALLYAQSGVGVKNSAHINGLAVDVLLYTRAGEYLTKTEDYKQLGTFWKSLHANCRWGGDFTDPRPDGNHFSFEYEGVK